MNAKPRKLKVNRTKRKLGRYGYARARVVVWIEIQCRLYYSWFSQSE